jgi:hypothetical protein
MASNRKTASGSKQSRSNSSDSSRSGSSRTRSAPATRARSSGARGASAKPRASARRSPQARSTASRVSAAPSGNGVVGTIKQAASKAKGPAVAVGATAVGVAGGMVLRDRMRRKTVLGIAVPRSLGTRSDVDLKSVAKSVGKASKQFGHTTKSISKDMERVGDQAERIGKMLD